MKIETKLNVGDDAFFLTGSAVRKSTITRIDISAVNTKFFDVTYTVKENPAGSQYTTRFNNSDIFPTKEALLASL